MDFILHRSAKGDVQASSDGTDSITASVSTLDIGGDADPKTKPTMQSQPASAVLECKCRMPLCICEAPAPSVDAAPIQVHIQYFYFSFGCLYGTLYVLMPYFLFVADQNHIHSAPPVSKSKENRNRCKKQTFYFKQQAWVG